MPSSERELVEIREDGREVYSYPDGTMRYANGSFAIAPPWKAPNFDETSADRRWAMVREASANGTIRGTGTQSEPEAVEAIAYTATKRYMEENTIASVHNLKLVMRMNDWLPDRGNGAPSIQQNLLVLSPGVLRALGVRTETETACDESSEGG